MEKIKHTSKKDRHVRWNWEESPERDSENRPNVSHYVRYHFIVVDDRNRGEIMNRLIRGLSRYGEIIEVRSIEGSVRGQGLRYLFKSYDSTIKPDMIDWKNVKKPIRKDSDLSERKSKRGNIEDYVARVYGG
ncbi:hypothetical protein J4429_04735 [Candidatus Pacearchaeota archaeon]|nr:hypothetical protein [Candidatus Pacearchaeota archaeon]